VLALLLMLSSTTSVLAHNMYMWPHFTDRKNTEVALAMLVEKDEVVWFDSMTVNLRMDGPSGEADLTVPEEGDPRVRFDQEGTYVIGWESEGLFIEVEPKIFNKYLAVEDYSSTIEARKKSGDEEKPGREIYSRYIKTFIQVGNGLSDHFSHPLNYKIEIIPLTNPASLKLNSDLEVKVLFEGKPLQKRRIMATYDSYSDAPEDYAQVTETDENGIARFRITHKGLWLVRTNQMIRLEGNPEADWQSFWANFTFEMK